MRVNPNTRIQLKEFKILRRKKLGKVILPNSIQLLEPLRVSFSAFKSKFEPYGPGAVVMKRDVFDHLPTYNCPLCHSLHGEGREHDLFQSLQQLSSHVKEAHDVVFYSTTTYSCQQVLFGRLIKAAHMWLNKSNETDIREEIPFSQGKED